MKDLQTIFIKPYRIMEYHQGKNPLKFGIDAIPLQYSAYYSAYYLFSLIFAGHCLHCWPWQRYTYYWAQFKQPGYF